MTAVAVTPKDTMTELEQREQSLLADIERVEEEVGAARVDLAGLILDAPGSQKLKAAKERLRASADELQTARADLEYVRLGRAEFARREVARLAREERERRLECVRRVHELQEDRERAAKRVDKAFADAVSALEDYYEACFSQRQEFRAAEMQQVANVTLPVPLIVDGSLVYAFRQAKVPFDGAISFLPPVPAAHVRPLAAADPDMRRHSLPEEATDGR